MPGFVPRKTFDIIQVYPVSSIKESEENRFHIKVMFINTRQSKIQFPRPAHSRFSQYSKWTEVYYKRAQYIYLIFPLLVLSHCSTKYLG
jgi:hypothetical protein